MLVVFDLDGVVIDTAEVIRRCYAVAGVMAPENILEMEGVPWLEREGYSGAAGEAVKRRKDELYADVLARGAVELLTGFSTAINLKLHHGIDCAIMTHAPLGSVEALRSSLGRRYWPFTFAVEHVTTPERMQLLEHITPKGVYVDDQDRLVRVPSGWSFIRYNRQHQDELTREIISCIYA